VSANGSKEPQSVRERLRTAGEQSVDQIEQFFLEALDAKRELHTTCTHCNRSTRVTVPDWASRLKAVDSLITQGYGRQAVQAEEPLAIIVERIWLGLDDETREFLTDEEIALVEEAQERYYAASAAATKKRLAATRHG
jgi:hypothetical protein